MGEIMRWRLTRAAQRRIPASESVLNLDGPYQINSATNNRIQNLHNAGQPASTATFASYISIVSNATALRRYLTTGNSTGTPASPNPTPVMRAAAALLQLDEWLAASAPVPPTAPPYTTPAVADLNKEITGVLGQYLPNSNAWKALHKLLSELFYVALVLSALVASAALTDVLGLLTRLLLVMGLVDDLQQPQSPIQTPDDIYAALRWRTILLPDNIVSVLLSIRASKNAVLVRKPGFADLYITREEWDHYEAAEIASIENILGRELKSRVHVLVNQTKVTTTTDQTTTTLKEQDTTTTDLSQLQQQSSSDISIAAHIEGQVNVSAQYGTAQINAHVGGSFDYSNASATSKATTQSHETVSRAVSMMEQTTRQVRTVSTLTRATDREEHKLDNTGQPSPVVGIYRWVNQVQNIELDRYPHRFLMEFEIPEPGAWTRWLQAKNAGRNMTHQLPVPLTVNGNPVTANNPLLQAKDISDNPTGANYFGKFAARYAAPGISPPPGPQTIAKNIGFPPAGTGANQNVEFAYQSDSSVSVPNGYFASSWKASFMFSNGDTSGLNLNAVDLAVGGGTPVVVDANAGGIATRSGNVGPISTGSIPFAIQAINVYGFEVNVEVSCMPLDQTYKQWQNDTYDAIVSAYNSMLQSYNDEKAGMTIQQTNPADANSPDQNAKTMVQELKRQVIEMLMGTLFAGLGAINWDSTGVTHPSTILSKAANFAPVVQFLEQAFEWETLSYICYPYYWADSGRWPDLAAIEGNDSKFVDFLRAGSARVVLAARPGFEDQVNFYVQFGILWGGGPMPAPGDPDYLSIADEIKAMQQRPLDVTVVDTWQVRLPTTLIWLENPDGLPKNTNPTIDTTPKIVSLSANSGAVGNTVTISGTNFGDIVGTSTVSFNGTEATPAFWSSTSINLNVPVGATTGDVVITVNGVVSNGVNFTVN